MFVIEAISNGKRGWVKETPGGFFFVESLAEATRWRTITDARVARCYIRFDNEPVIVELMSPIKNGS